MFFFKKFLKSIIWSTIWPNKWQSQLSSQVYNQNKSQVNCQLCGHNNFSSQLFGLKIIKIKINCHFFFFWWFGWLWWKLANYGQIWSIKGIVGSFNIFFGLFKCLFCEILVKYMSFLKLFWSFFSQLKKNFFVN